MPYKVVKDRKYLKEHDWAKKEDGLVLIGITDFAQQTLKDIVYVELPEVGESVEAGEVFGSIESVKAVSDLSIVFTFTIPGTMGSLGCRTR